MGLRTLLTKLGTEHGIEIDPEELEGLGLSDDVDLADEHQVLADVLSQELPGTAAGVIELFLAADSTKVDKPVEEKDDLMWYPIIREGQWAVRPGTTGTKKRVPLKIIAGKSKNQRREIGLQDLHDAFYDEAIQHVTVPTSHANTTLENTGFIKGMKIVQGTVKNAKTKKDEKVAVLLGGYDIKLPAVKERMQLGAIANRSAGILYDYVNTETGKSYPAVIEHVALTNKPWITGMVSFGRKLSEGGIDTIGMSLSDEAPLAEEEYALALSDEANLPEDEADFLAQGSGNWTKEGSPAWLRKQVNTRLSDARQEKERARRKKDKDSFLYESLPYYRCVEAKPGQALISDGYDSDDANFWTAPITVKDGVVELADFTQWSPLTKAFVPDERPAPPADKLPLDEEQNGNAAPAAKSRLELAQEARRRRATTPGEKTDNNPREVVKQDMADQSSTLQLSEEAQKVIQAAEAKSAELEARLKLSDEKIARLTGSVVGREVDSYIGELKTNLGLTEERGFGGVLTEIRALMLADDGEPAVQSESFADDGNKEGELSLSDAIRRIFSSFEKVGDAKKNLGEVLSEPASQEAAATKVEGEKKEGDELSETVASGKPGAGEAEGDKLSTDEKKAKIFDEAPGIAALVGKTTINTGGDA